MEIEIFDDDFVDDIDFTPCDNCDLPDACSDFGCAIKQGLKDERDFVDWMIDQQPELSEAETKKALLQMEKCADYIVKNRIEPNLDSIY